ncbi:SulP family inorganic anion transporter [Actinospongicola halichondriae]|uniref:SulP family inorganic anion transporter n=1 Tax=Actinospongicola halichondriae TaxID=3236844 RepID=UPI003D50622B
MSTPSTSGAPALLGALRSRLPSTADYGGIRESWRSDVVAGVTVGIVALPLALAFGITSGLGASAGLITAIVAGVVAGVFGGSHVQVSGPTGAMTVVLVPVVARHGADAVLIVAFMAGVVIVAAGLAGFGRFLAFVPWPVIEGFTVGIAVIIFLQQVPAGLGVEKPDGENTALVAWRSFGEVAAEPSTWWALGLVVGVAVLMGVLPRIHTALPASLVAVVAATVAVALADAPVALIGSLPDSLPSPSMSAFDFGLVSQLSGAILAVAVLGALESLLSAKVADGMAGVGRHDPNRELVGQGLANMVSPMFGGMPATGAIARTAVNVRAGARTRVSSIVHALVLIFVVYIGGQAVGRVPLPALAGVLMVTAVRMVDAHAVRAISRTTRSDATVLVITALVTIGFDLILAVEVGMATAAVLALRQVARASTPVEDPLPLLDRDTVDELRRLHIATYRLDGNLFFGAVQRFLAALTEDHDVRVLILRLPDLKLLDATGAQAIGELIDDLEAKDITVLLKGPSPEHLRILNEVGSIGRLAHENHLFDDLDAAIAHARRHATVPTN